MSYKLYVTNNNYKIRYDSGSFRIFNSSIVTPTPTLTRTPTPTPTLTRTSTPTPSITSSSTPTPTSTVTITPTPSITLTSTPSLTPTITLTPSSASSLFKTSNTANYSNCASWDSLGGNVTTIGSNGNPSAYNIYDMAASIYEWTERTWFSSSKGLKGGAWSSDSTRLNRSFEAYQAPTFTSNIVGFRVATVASTPLFQYGTIGDINNQNDSAGIGSVSYEFKMGKFEVTNTEYVEFLNNIGVTDTYEVYSSLMSEDRGGIWRSGSNGSYVYSVKTNYANKPATCISWYNAARYCNWLHNGKPSGLQNNTTTEDGAYQLTGNTGLPSRKFSAIYFIPSADEWQKAAFYKSGSTNAGYWDYATQSNTAPTCISANASGDGTL